MVTSGCAAGCILNITKNNGIYFFPITPSLTTAGNLAHDVRTVDRPCCSHSVHRAWSTFRGRCSEARCAQPESPRGLWAVCHQRWIVVLGCLLITPSSSASLTMRLLPLSRNKYLHCTISTAFYSIFSPSREAKTAAPKFAPNGAARVAVLWAGTFIARHMQPNSPVAMEVPTVAGSGM